MNDILVKYLPDNAIDVIAFLIRDTNVHFKVVGERSSKKGDFSVKANQQEVITVNASLNKYAFLITTIHEFAHLFTYRRYGQSVKPHGKEWKSLYRELMNPLLNTGIFPLELLKVLRVHFQHPTASTSTDSRLSLVLRKYDEKKDTSTCTIHELMLGDIFRYQHNRIFKIVNKKTKRYECKEINTGKLYLFQPHTIVQPINA